jgi:type VI secretion system secreted protein Hcp
LTITKAIGVSSPQICQALCTNELLKEVTIDFYQINDKGNEENYYRIQLKNAHIVKVESRMASVIEKSKESEVPLEDVSFAYQTIEWNHLIGSTMSMDDWVQK